MDRGLGDDHQPVLLAGTNELVDRLNAAVIARLRATGDLRPPEHGHLAVGERIVARRNTVVSDSDGASTGRGRPVAIANGQAGTINAIDQGALTVRFDGQRADVVLPADYVAASVTHAYALTIHRAQGGTWDQAIVVGADGLYREGAYVALSRGRHSNVLMLTDPELAEIQLDDELDRHDHGLELDVPPGVDDELTRRFTSSHAKQLAHHLDSDVSFVDRLARTLPFTEIEQMADYATDVEHLADQLVGTSCASLEGNVARTIHTARHLRVGGMASPEDRHNLGVVIDVDDAAGTATLHFASAEGREHVERFPWSQLRVVDADAAERELSPSARRALAVMLAPTVDDLERWHAIVDDLGVELGEGDRYRHALHNIVERATAKLIADQPDWLRTFVGAKPFDPAGDQVWHDNVQQIARYRVAHELHDSTSGIGPRPIESDGVGDGADWDRLQLHVARTRVWLATSDRLEPTYPIAASRRELHERRQQLGQLFATAPAHARHTVDELLHGRLDLNDTADVLARADLATDARRRWIIDNWPHVVEFQEINRTLATGTWGPDPALLDAIAGPHDHPLVQDIAHQPVWLRQALGRIAEPDATELSQHQIDRLSAIAHVRQRLGIAPSAPVDHQQLTAAAALDTAHRIVRPDDRRLSHSDSRSGSVDIDLD